MHVILGANGVIARELSAALAARGARIRQVSRNPRPVDPGDETHPADLTDAAATAAAVEGARIAYLVAGLKYDAAVWAEAWPKIMRNAIDGCARAGCRLVFFDNVYAYGRVEGPMTEDTPFNPCSRKGAVRARIATMLLEAMRAGTVEGMILRAPDFYGPGATRSFPHAMVFECLRAGRTPQWLGNPAAAHAFIFTPDAGRAVAAIAAEPAAWGATWHLPTSDEAMSGAIFVRTACGLAGRPFGMRTVPRWLLRLLGLVNPVLRENDEMMYQFEYDYRFDSARVRTTFGLAPTSYRDGIAACLAAR